METLFLPALHLFVLVGFIFYKSKAPFVSFVRGRHQQVSDGLNRAKLQAAQAQAQKKEAEAKFASLQTEKEKIFSEWKEREQLQLKAIKENSNKIISIMTSDAEQSKKALEEQVRGQIMKRFSDMIVTQAEEKIKQGLSKESHQKQNSQFIKEVSL